jgi:hypothetical protein
MPVESAMSVAVCSALRSALLLTGSAASAESMVLEAIRSLDPQNVIAETLLQRTIELSIQSVACSDGSDVEIEWPGLPIELRNVLEMKAPLRQCFVLRVLLSLPEEMCAGLLRLSRSEVGSHACAAMNWLAARKKNNLEFTRGIESHREVGGQMPSFY